MSSSWRPGAATAAYFLSEAGWQNPVLEQVLHFFFESVLETRLQMVGYTLGERQVSVPVPHRDARPFDAHFLAHTKAEVPTGATVRRVLEAADRVSPKRPRACMTRVVTSSTRTARLGARDWTVNRLALTMLLNARL